MVSHIVNLFNLQPIKEPIKYNNFILFGGYCCFVIIVDTHTHTPHIAFSPLFCSYSFIMIHDVLNNFI